MIALFRRHAVGCLALVVALSGTAYAATKIGPQQIAKDAVRAKHVRADAIRAAEVASDAVGIAEIASDAVGSAEVAPSAVGSAQVADGSLAGSDLAPGAVGPQQASLYSGNLRSGQVMRGTYSIRTTKESTASTASGAAISFPFPLASAPQMHLIEEGQTPPAACPGSAASPGATAGHLCVFEADNENANTWTPSAPAGASSGRFGAVISALPEGGTAVNALVSSQGTWAVMAP